MIRGFQLRKGPHVMERYFVEKEFDFRLPRNLEAFNQENVSMSSGECYIVLTPFCQLSRKLSLKFAALKKV